MSIYLIRNGYRDTAVCRHNYKNIGNCNKEREITWPIINFNLMLHGKFITNN